VLARRCRFVFEENQRVAAFFAALVRDDREAMRELCAQSFRGERDLYEKTVPAMERMYEAMTSGPGVVAARQLGGGFGGAMIAYVLHDRVPEFSAHVMSSYRQKTGIEPALHVTLPMGGAGPLEV
jgi:galactokinase